MSRQGGTSSLPSVAATPAPSSPRISESNLSELDGTAPSIVETSGGGGEYSYGGWDGGSGVDAKTLNLVSWKLDVNARAEDGIEKRGFNAISTVLNHPTKKANPLRASRKPLPPIQAPPALPRPPPPSAYDAYLQAVTPLYDSFLSAQASSSTSASPLTGSFDPKPPDTSAGAGSLPPLDNIPEAFFSPDFDLSKPVTWSSVVGTSSSGSGPAKSASPDGVVDTLSTHLDSLERHLIHEITLRSTSFFSALSNLQDLHSESASCLGRISDLQGSLREVGEQQARKGLQVIEAQEQLRNRRVMQSGVREIGELEELVRTARALVEHGDWAAGLACLADVVRWWEKHGLEHAVSDQAQKGSNREGTVLPLATLPALASLPEALDHLSNAIAEQLEASIAALLLATLSQADADSASPYDADEFARSATPMLDGLAQCGQLGAVEGVLREVVILAVREGSRKHLPVASAEDDAGGPEDGRGGGGGIEMRGANLASALKQMDHRRYLLLSTQMFGTMLARLRLAHTVGAELDALLARSSAAHVHLRIASFVPTAMSPSGFLAAGEGGPKTGSLGLDVSDIVASACELANLRASKILAVRSEQHAGLQLPEFVEIFKENWEFVVETEGLAKRMIVSLRGVTAAQGRTFLIAYHSFRLTRSAKLVEEEQWAQIDVSPQVQHVVNVLIEAAVKDPLECFVPSGAETTDGPMNGSGAGEAGKTLDIENKSFFVVKATAESLVLLGDYLKIVVNLELVVTDVMARIIEFLKSFNSRTCQVVLGAGAMRSAGLKNITAKHLALASQSLSIIVSLIPYIREFVRRHLNPKQAVMLTEFDKLKRDYQDHQNEIHAKLVAIMSDRLSVHVGTLRDIDWEQSPEKDVPRGYAEMLVKESATLHKVLSKYLSVQTVETVMSEVLAAIHHRLSEEYTKIELKSEDAKKRMLQDATLLSSKLSSLAEAGKVIASLETLVKDKPLPRKPMGETVKGLWKRGGAVPGKEGEQGVDVAQNGNGVEGEEGDGGAEDDEDEDGEGLGIVPEDATGPTEEVPPIVERPRTPEKRSGQPNDAAAEQPGDATAPGAEAIGPPVPAPAVPEKTIGTQELRIDIPSPAGTPPPAVSVPAEAPAAKPVDSAPSSPPPPRTASLQPASADPSVPSAGIARTASPNFERRSHTPVSSLFARLASPPPQEQSVQPSIQRAVSPPPPSNPYAPALSAAGPSTPSPAAGAPSTPQSAARQLNSPAAAASPISPSSYAVRQPRVSLANRLRGVITRQGSQEPEAASPVKAGQAGSSSSTLSARPAQSPPAPAASATLLSTDVFAASGSGAAAEPVRSLSADDEPAMSETAAPPPPVEKRDRPVQENAHPPALPDKEDKADSPPSSPKRDDGTNEGASVPATCSKALPAEPAEQATAAIAAAEPEEQSETLPMAVEAVSSDPEQRSSGDAGAVESAIIREEKETKAEVEATHEEDGSA